METSISERYDSYQVPAVKAVVREFSANPTGRFLLSIPTGGGKTIAAVKAVICLFEEGILDKGKDVVVWTAHRKELLDQAKGAFDWVAEQLGLESLPEIRFPTIQIVQDTVDFPEIKLVVIDEAHHSKAPSYQHFFTNQNIGILGLTATPSRHDGDPLQFDKEAYSIGFPDLVRKKVILRPKIFRIDGGKFDDIDSIDNTAQLEVLNNKERNHRIIRCIDEHQEKFKKIVIYVGTTQHVHDLYDEIRESSVFEKYESVSYITQEGNSRGIDRGLFFDAEHKEKKSIIINVNILSEGYDDPTINTAILAMPTRSKLYYMQAMGRAIRLDPDDALKNAYLVEVDTKLPNISYQIDNRWLYSDVSDSLEPRVEDVIYSSSEILIGEIEKLYKRFDVPKEWRQKISPKEHERYSMLIFKRYRQQQFVSFPILLTGENRQDIVALFNRLSAKMPFFVKNKYGWQQIDNIEKGHPTRVLLEDDHYSVIIDSMRNAYCHLQQDLRTPLITEGHPWIRFVSFIFHEDDDLLPSALIEFVEDMINKDEVIAAVGRREYEAGDILLRLPLLLKGSVGKIVSAAEGRKISDVVIALGVNRDSGDPSEQNAAVSRVLHDVVLPIEVGYVESLVIIARERCDYWFDLSVIDKKGE